MALKYSLGTKLILSNNLIDILNPLNSNTNFDGSFRKDDQFYSTILWNEDQDQKTSYKIELDKIYICSSTSDYVPSYDPDGSIYNKGPQFGCSKAHKSLINRILLLDRQIESSSPSNTSMNLINNKRIKLDAQFLTDYLLNYTHNENSNNNQRSPKNGKLVMDGFKFNINSLIDLESYTKKTLSTNNNIVEDKESIWYVQVLFIIRPSDLANKKARNLRQASNIYSLNSVYNNGTNIQTFRLNSNERLKSINILNDMYNKNKKIINEKEKFISMNAKLKHKNRLTESQYRKINKSRENGRQNYFLSVVVPIMVFLILLTIAFGSVLYLKKRSIIKFINKNRKNSSKIKQTTSESNKNNIASNQSDSMSSTETQTTLMVNNSSLTNPLNRLRTLFRKKWNTSQSKIEIYKPRLLKKKNKLKRIKKQTISQSNENYSGTNSTSDTIVVNSPLLLNNNLNGTEIIIHHETTNNKQEKRSSILNIDYKKASLTEEDAYNSLENEASNLDKILTSLNNELNDYSISLNRQQTNSNYFRFPDIQEPITSTNVIEQENINNNNNNNNNMDYDENIYRIDPNVENINSIHDDLKSMDKDILKKNHDSTKKLNTFKMILQKMSNNGSPSKLSNKSQLSKSVSKQNNVDMTQYDEDMNYFEEDSTTSNRTIKYNHNFNPNNNCTIVTSKPPIASSSSSTITRKTNANKNRNNYLYFNYNNNKMHYYNTDTCGDCIIDNEIIMNESVMNTTNITSYTPLIPDVMSISMHSSTPNQVTPVSSTTKCSIGNKAKRISGTEV